MAGLLRVSLLAGAGAWHASPGGSIARMFPAVMPACTRALGPGPAGDGLDLGLFAVVVELEEEAVDALGFQARNEARGRLRAPGPGADPGHRGFVDAMLAEHLGGLRQDGLAPGFGLGLRGMPPSDVGRGGRPPGPALCRKASIGTFTIRRTARPSQRKTPAERGSESRAAPEGGASAGRAQNGMSSSKSPKPPAPPAGFLGAAGALGAGAPPPKPPPPPPP